MRSSVTINDPSSSSSSSSSSPLSRINQATENEGKDRDGLDVETGISDLNRSCKGLGHEVSRLILDNVEKNKKLMYLKRRIEEFDQGENQLNREVEQLEQKVLMLMLEIGERNDKYKDLGIGIEETKKCEKDKVFKGLGTGLAKQEVNLRQLVSDEKELEEMFEIMGKVVDEVVNANDDGKHEEEEEIMETGVRELCKEIELLEEMSARGSFGLLDLQTMMEEVEALTGPEKMMSEMEEKLGELESGLWELKNAIVELKGKKSKELMDWVAQEEEKEMECEGGQEKVNARKFNWGSIIASVGAAAVAAVAVIFMGRTMVEVKAKRGNKRETG